MERIYRVTPEMYGIGWRGLLRNALGMFAVVAAVHLFFSHARHRELRVTSDVLGPAIIAWLVSSFVALREVPKALRLTDNSIEEVNGKVIGRGEVKRVKECRRRWLPGFLNFRPGLAIIGQRSDWIRGEYSIFIPAALPEYDEIKGIVLGWGDAQSWEQDAGTS